MALTTFRVFGGSANPQLTTDICENLGVAPVPVKMERFADGELYLQIQENIRGLDMYVIQPTCAPVNDNLMEMTLMLNAARLASAKKLTAVLPYFGYARQDRKDKPRVPLSAKVAAQLIETQRPKRIVTMDLHSAPIQGFFNAPVDNLYALPVFLDYIRTHYDLAKLVIVSPDAGGVTRARLMSKKLGVPLAIIDKSRAEANVAEVHNVIGDVKGMACLMVDDMIDTAGTLCKGAVALMEHNALSVDAAATHAVLSPHTTNGKQYYAKERIYNSPLGKVLLTDTIPDHFPNNPDGNWNKKIERLTVAPLIASAIKAISENLSISALFS